METATIQKNFYCGGDLHAKTMFLSIMDAKGEILFHRNIPNNPPYFLSVIQPYRHSIAVGVESTFNWYWLADTCQKENIPFFLGHALYMKAIHGGKNKNDRIDATTIANLLKCNMFPPAYPYPKEMRGTRDLLRRRYRYVTLRAESYTHIQGTFNQQAIDGVSSSDVKRKSSRADLPNHFDHPDIAMSVNCDIELSHALDPIINKIEKQVYTRAKYHDHNALSILMTTPGIGKILAFTILYEIYTINRFPSVQNFSSYCRLVKCERTSNGKYTGDGNNKIGNPYLKWAFSEIIIHAQTHSPNIKKYYERLISKHGEGIAKSIMAHKFAVAVYFMLKKQGGIQ